MRKTMGLLTLFAVFLTAFAFTACGDDDDSKEKSGNAVNSIVGYWLDEENESVDTFTADGLWLSKSYNKGRVEVEVIGKIVYDASANVIRLWEKEDEDEPFLMYVTWLSKDKIIITEKDGDRHNLTRTNSAELPARFYK